MTTTTIFLAALLIAGFLLGIRLMQSPETALWGNRLGALCMLGAVVLTIQGIEAAGDLSLWALLLAGGLLGITLGQRVKMIQMPQTVALLNGFGGGASALVAATAVAISTGAELWVFWLTAALALGIGTLTFSGSLIAALKLQGWISQKPVFVRAHAQILWLLLLAGAVLVFLLMFSRETHYQFLIAAVFALYGLFMSIRIGGADMPVVISLLNSFSGIAAAVSGLAVGNALLAGVGSLVGVAGMILTQLMCKAMNKSLPAVLAGFKVPAVSKEGVKKEAAGSGATLSKKELIPALLQEARKVVIVPGYGMARAQAQQSVKELMLTLEKEGKEVKFAIHPVAGRMPGHMNVLLAEVGVDYEKLCDMEVINPEFSETDVVIVIGASDTINPAATTAEGTPIYGMPILNVSEARNIIICNTGKKSAYSGVENALYNRDNVIGFWGDAAETVPKITEGFKALKVS